MTLKQAIERARERGVGHTIDAADNRHLVAWLEELYGRRKRAAKAAATLKRTAA